jgi:hypothetical protein
MYFKKPISVQLFFSDAAYSISEKTKSIVGFLQAKKGYQVHQKDIFLQTNTPLIDKTKVKAAFEETFNKIQKEGWLKDAVNIAIVQMQANHNLSINSFSELKYLAAKYGISISVDFYSIANSKMWLESYLIEKQHQEEINFQLEEYKEETISNNFIFDYSFSKSCINSFIWDDSLLLSSFNAATFSSLTKASNSTNHLNNTAELFATQSNFCLATSGSNFTNPTLLKNSIGENTKLKKKRDKIKRKFF